MDPSGLDSNERTTVRAQAKSASFAEPYINWAVIQFWVEMWPEIAAYLYRVDDVDREFYLDTIGGE